MKLRTNRVRILHFFLMTINGRWSAEKYFHHHLNAEKRKKKVGHTPLFACSLGSLRYQICLSGQLYVLYPLRSVSSGG